MLNGACGEPDAGPTRTSGSGGRHEETGREQSRNRASCRPHHDIALVDDRGQLIAKRRIDDDAAGFSALVQLLADHGDTADEPIPVAIETGRGLLVACLRSTGRPVYAINPLAVSRYRERHSVARPKVTASRIVIVMGVKIRSCRRITGAGYAALPRR